MDDLAALVRSVANYTLTTKVRCHAMIDALQIVDRNGILGDIVECGVWRGGNIILARKVSPLRLCWLYDTFTGMTMPGPEDMRRSGIPASEDIRAQRGVPWCAASIDEVKQCLRDTDVYDDDRLRFVVGQVEATLLDPDNLPDGIAVLRLDTDWYQSTKIELEVLFPRLQSGGVLIVDDYGHWKGARKAVDEYFDGQRIEFEQIDYSAVMMVKP